MMMMVMVRPNFCPFQGIASKFVDVWRFRVARANGLLIIIITIVMIDIEL